MQIDCEGCMHNASVTNANDDAVLDDAVLW
jgi:hypothetical protein